jgi:hypothetical protein
VATPTGYAAAPAVGDAAPYAAAPAAVSEPTNVMSGSSATGRWIRRGRKIIVLGV